MKDYTNYDYQALVDKATLLLSQKEGWGDGYDSSVGQTLIQLLADVTDSLHYMLERRTRENYRQTAMLHSSIVARACELGYRPLRARGNRGLVDINLVDGTGAPVNASEDIIIPPLTTLSFGDKNYTTIKQVVIDAGESGATGVEIREGTPFSEIRNITSDGFFLVEDYQNIDNDVFLITENEIPYYDVLTEDNDNIRALIFAGPEDRYYDIRYVVDGMRVVFGDNVFGKRPEGDLLMSYLLVDPTNEPVITTGNTFTFDSPIEDLFGNTYATTVTNTTRISGGSDVEDDESIRSNAAQYHRTNGNAVSNADFEFWIMRSGIGKIVDVRVFGEYEIDSLVYNLNNIYITYLTESGDDLTPDEKLQILEYLKNYRTSFVHPVFLNANTLEMMTTIDVGKNINAPVANAELYDILLKFLKDQFTLTKGSIGKGVQTSDLVNEMYKLKVTRDNIVYNLIDFVKIVLKGIYPFSYPLRSDRATVELSPTYAGDRAGEFVVNLENLVCKVDVALGETNTDILLKMRDRIMEVTPFKASVELVGVVLDAFGNPVPVEISPKVGYNLLIGVDTPYFSPTDLVSTAVIGSSIVSVVTTSPAIDINHYYYSPKAGRRPMIPMRIGTEITFTAPSDTSVNVYTRLIADDPSTEVLLTTLTPNQLYSQTFNAEHTLQFEYIDDSADDRIVEISYPSFEGASYGLVVRTVDGFGKFDVVTTSGDFSDLVSVDYQIKLPVKVTDELNTSKLNPGTVNITSMDGVLVFKDRGNGFFETPGGVISSSGRIDYISGVVSLPTTLTPGDYLFMYEQDAYGTFSVTANQVIKLVEPKPSLSSTASSLSQIRIVS